MPSYIPNAQTALRTWANNFAALITATPAVYGLTAADATTIQGVVDDFDAALTLAIDPSTRTPATVADKDAKRASMLGVVRPYAILIRNNAGISDELKAGLGLTIPDRTPTPIPAPGTLPLLNVLFAQPQTLTLKFADSTTPTKKAKPFGAIALEVHAAASATAITDPALLPQVGNKTKTPFVLSFAAGDVGKTAYIAARWVTRRGLVGPWSDITTAVVA